MTDVFHLKENYEKIQQTQGQRQVQAPGNGAFGVTLLVDFNNARKGIGEHGYRKSEKNKTRNIH